jgi:glycosyltransferase involved in cell wall biosynthesis
MADGAGRLPGDVLRRPRLAVVLKGYPRLSETFIAQELRELERRGLAFDIWSLRKPTDSSAHAIHAEIAAPVTYLPEYLHQEPARVLAALLGSMARPGFWRALGAFLSDLANDASRNRVRRFGQACVLAAERPEPLGLIYAHFLHTPGSVARYAAMIRGTFWAFSAHARDIWTTPAWEKRQKIDDALFGVTCTRSGAEHLNMLGAERRVGLAYHGLDLARWPAPAEARPLRRGDKSDPVTILSVGRMVEKKGLDHLLLALADLPEALHWKLTHIGGGPLEAPLKAMADRLGVAQRCQWLGQQERGQVQAAMRKADLFALPSKIASDGDRDGLPNVLLEAASQMLPIVASRMPGTAEFIRHKKEGLLVRPGRVRALTQAIDRLARDPELRVALAASARLRLEEKFIMGRCVKDVERALREALSFSERARAGLDAAPVN